MRTWHIVAALVICVACHRQTRTYKTAAGGQVDLLDILVLDGTLSFQYRTRKADRDDVLCEAEALISTVIAEARSRGAREAHIVPTLFVRKVMLWRGAPVVFTESSWRYVLEEHGGAWHKVGPWKSNTCAGGRRP